MSSTVRLATFNCENLFARWRFRADVDPTEANTRGWVVDQTKFEELGVESKAITGAAVRDLDAQIVALQEVENVDTLKHFRTQFLGGNGTFPYVAGVDGNDPRLIDVAVLSKLPITHIRSYQHLRDPEEPTKQLFSRDCLEVDVRVSDATTITLFVQHFKSMMGGREQTHGKRARQAARVMEIVAERFGDRPADQPFVVLGDFNDYLDEATSIEDLVHWDQVENVVERLPEDEQWTHYFAREDEYKQLDYLLPSTSLAARIQNPPAIFRKGTPLRATRYKGERYAGIGLDRPKASDHCPLYVDVEVT
ncbi:endonuclease/exonuclease/phosphatase family protein [Streptomyces sp. NBC_01275]|uniref:endonuclease/exonuclease/phosphatase family protein n=1 Tax=Streptomyces sp. NBC_01275 TaxID=2903807 RepID=UPI0022596AB8|nr:endonuclease/exonuclease/phosphatase family protein [Streptomyces sp. NBC_01275]MCX4766833.1 endonuclease/exonuclease/phosphatase family protein [Streptomyces sp. NBC_01275]